ncbi:rubredoxin-like domain-containing protein [Candidatus Stoquefichus sp. SB1]|uniref:rubredoxin-like domain-containing protein n=1 Tax=Candidatus Stoquefichus sp. SB1 TaxID=1658109 RepID=UPI00067EC4AF|nr:rubredoxin [Candidatus Stoquefichus sp. SB1]
MAKYVCQVCGFIYDEEKVNPKVLWDQLDSNWVCPICKAPKSAFKKLVSEPEKKMERKEVTKDWSPLELSILLSNLAKGCEKQYLAHEQELFLQLADYYQKCSLAIPSESVLDLLPLVEEDLNQNYPLAHQTADQIHDRGAKRALVWSEKSTHMIASLLEQYQKAGNQLLKDTKVFVCEICGFISIGQQAPEICPVCKVPRLKIHEVKRGLEL